MNDVLEQASHIVGDKDMQKEHDREVKNFFREEEL